jgi:hypothetical protein
MEVLREGIPESTLVPPKRRMRNSADADDDKRDVEPKWKAALSL